jgi:alanine racemase
VKSWIEVSRERLAENYRAATRVAQQEAGRKTAVLAVIKANAYGHDATLCAPVLAGAGAPWLGVTDAIEGAAVREALAAAGISTQPKILVMCGYLPEDAAAIVRDRLTPVVWTQEQMEALAEASGAEPVAVHLEVDTGMSRQGVVVEKLRMLLQWMAGEPRVRLDGVMTHFASAEIAGSDQTAVQRERFEQAIRIVAEENARPAWVHAGNTSAIDNGADGRALTWLSSLAERLDAGPMVRAGLGLYGYCLPLEGLVASDGEGTARLQPVVEPVMTWKTRIIGISEVEAGARIGYSGTFVAGDAMRLALLPIGYADGLRRELSCSARKTGGWVVIRGNRAPIAGRVSMNLTTVDVTGISEAAVGDEVVLLGEECTAEDHAAIAGTISYEILCGMRAPVILV